MCDWMVLIPTSASATPARCAKRSILTAPFREWRSEGSRNRAGTAFTCKSCSTTASALAAIAQSLPPEGVGPPNRSRTSWTRMMASCSCTKPTAADGKTGERRKPRILRCSTAKYASAIKGACQRNSVATSSRTSSSCLKRTRSAVSALLRSSCSLSTRQARPVPS